MYSPLGLVIFVAVEGTFVCFTKGHDHLFQIQLVAAAYEKKKKNTVYWQRKKRWINTNT